MNYAERKVHHEENDEDWNVFCGVYVSCSSFSKQLLQLMDTYQNQQVVYI